tara:strand:+ start:27762 stop:28361 length:600 start_codon:yes stop_codon:yes gene_type:complete
MIIIKNQLNAPPYKRFYAHYQRAIKVKQKNPEAVCISSFDKNLEEINARYVNLKYINGNQWIFFTNYDSDKAKDFESHPYVAATLYWNKLNIQIRIKATIKKSSKQISDCHFNKRSSRKNALAVSSMQSKKIESYEIVKENYRKVLNNKDLLNKRPNYWGGYSFQPFHFEFWEGQEQRLNKREVFKKTGSTWENIYLQP